MLLFARIWIWEYMEITKNTDYTSLLSHIYYNNFFLGGLFSFCKTWVKAYIESCKHHTITQTIHWPMLVRMCLMSFLVSGGAGLKRKQKRKKKETLMPKPISPISLTLVVYIWTHNQVTFVL